MKTVEGRTKKEQIMELHEQGVDVETIAAHLLSGALVRLFLLV